MITGNLIHPGNVKTKSLVLFIHFLILFLVYSRKPPVRSVYPRNINNWDLPSNINGAVQWKNKRTYFFKYVLVLTTTTEQF